MGDGGTGSGSCSVVSFGVCGVDPLDSASRQLVGQSVLCFSLLFIENRRGGVKLPGRETNNSHLYDAELKNA